MYYIGFLKDNPKHTVVFQSTVVPKRKDYSYFVKVMGPYSSEGLAKNALAVLKRKYGYKDNPIKGLITKAGIRKCGALSKKIIKMYGKVRKKNPGKAYHDKKFFEYSEEMKKHRVGSMMYIETLTKAYEHLKSSLDS